MQEFLRLCRRLPVNLLFVRGERFNDEGYRWAPKSFIPKCTTETAFVYNSPIGELLTIERDVVECTGLYCNHSGFLIDFPEGELVNDVFFFYCHITKHWYTVSDPQDGETATRKTRGINGLDRPAILVPSTLGISAVVNITRKAEDGRYFATYITRTFVLRQTPEFTNKINPVMEAPGRYRPKKIDDLKHIILHGEKCGDAQTWCIS